MGRKPKHFPSFFKVLIGDFAHKLRIPPAFVANFEVKFPATAHVIKVDTGESWAVEVKQIGENHCFTNPGWQKFVKDNQLKYGDFAVFSLISNLVLEIVAYGPNGCEKKLNPAIRSNTEVEPTVSGENKENPFMERSTRSRKSKDSPARGYIRRWRGVAEAAGSSNPMHPCFLVVVKKYHRYYINLPKAFATEIGIAGKKSVMLRNEEGKVWPVEVRLRSYGRFDFTVGWSDFRIANQIAIGDTCLFKFIQSGGNVIHVEVHQRPPDRKETLRSSNSYRRRS